MYRTRILTDMKGRPLDKAVQSVVKDIVDEFRRGAPKTTQEAVYWTLHGYILHRRWGFSRRHWRVDKYPSKLTKGVCNDAVQEVDVNIAGANRALHDIHIKPKKGKYLTIPIHKMAYGKSARSFKNLFVVTRKKDSKKFLAKMSGKDIHFLYVLKKNVFQRKDSTYLPTDDIYKRNIKTRLFSLLDNIVKKKQLAQ